MTEIDHECTTFPVCPYCGKEFDDAYEWRSGADESSWQECDNCGKKFLWNRNVTIDYCTEKAPCLNGEGPHSWKPIHGFPPEYFAGKERCSACGEERKVDGD